MIYLKSMFYRRLGGFLWTHKEVPHMENKDLRINPVKTLEFICTNAYKHQVS